MTHTPAHSPLPFALAPGDNQIVIDDEGLIVTILNDNKFKIEANVDFILRACNSHYGLLEALKEAYKKLKIECGGAKEYKGGVPSQVLFPKIEVIIAKAEGK